jgi:NADH:quinone reductase (non-electrogenic)
VLRYDVLVVGGGFGGAFAARELERRFKRRAERTLLVAPDNFLLFSPLLPEAASGTLEPRHAVVPLRDMLRRTDVLVGSVERIDLDTRTASLVGPDGSAREIAFRAVVLAPGSRPMTLPIPGLAEHAVGFKTLADAIWLRNRVLAQLEAGDAMHDLARRRAALTFTFIGGGYAGVEALAELESLVRDALRLYPNLRRDDLRWVLVEAQDGLLAGLDPRLAAYTADRLRARGVEVHLCTRLTSCVDQIVTLDDAKVEPFRSETIIWATGQRPSDFVAALGLPLERGRVVVDDHLRASGRTDVFAAGDAAAVPDPGGGWSPPTAQHALREGRVAGANAAASVGVGAPIRYRYKNRGLAVTLGRWDGTAQVKRFTFRGPLAWWMGRSYHLLMLPGVARKARVVSDWTTSLLFPRDVAQLGSLGRPTPLPSAGRHPNPGSGDAVRVPGRRPR